MAHTPVLPRSLVLLLCGDHWLQLVPEVPEVSLELALVVDPVLGNELLVHLQRLLAPPREIFEANLEPSVVVGVLLGRNVVEEAMCYGKRTLQAGREGGREGEREGRRGVNYNVHTIK